MGRARTLVVGLLLTACMSHQRLWVASEAGRACVQQCRDLHPGDEARMACAASCDSAVAEEGTCADRDLGTDACIERSRVRAGRVVLFVALAAIAVAIGISIAAGPQT